MPLNKDYVIMIFTHSYNCKGSSLSNIMAVFMIRWHHRWNHCRRCDGQDGDERHHLLRHAGLRHPHDVPLREPGVGHLSHLRGARDPRPRRLLLLEHPRALPHRDPCERTLRPHHHSSLS